MSVQQDPRLEDSSNYDRSAMTSVFLDFYTFLSSMPPYRTEDVLLHPPEGWPNITEEHFAPLGKNSTAIDLLKHLPYLNMDSQEYIITPGPTMMLDSRGEAFKRALQTNFERAPSCWFVCPYTPPDGFPPWVVPITTGIIRGEYAMLDASDGTITRQVQAAGGYEPSYASDDLRKWRDDCTDDTVPVAEYFDELKDSFKRSVWLPYYSGGKFALSVAGESPQEHEQLSAIYRHHGWPSTFKRELCRLALLRWDEQRTH